MFNVYDRASPLALKPRSGHGDALETLASMDSGGASRKLGRYGRRQRLRGGETSRSILADLGAHRQALPTT